MEQFVGVKGSPDESGKKGTEIKNEKCQACIYFINSVQEQCLCDKSEVGCFTLFTWMPSAYEGESKTHHTWCETTTGDYRQQKFNRTSNLCTGMNVWPSV